MNPKADDPKGGFATDSVGDKPSSPELEDIHQAVQKTVAYLYPLPDDCPPELAKIIGMLRQLINEEFVAKDKMVSSEAIYKIVSPQLNQLIATKCKEARIDELEGLEFTELGEWDRMQIENRLKTLRGQS